MVLLMIAKVIVLIGLVAAVVGGAITYDKAHGEALQLSSAREMARLEDEEKVLRIRDDKAHTEAAELQHHQERLATSIPYLEGVVKGLKKDNEDADAQVKAEEAVANNVVDAGVVVDVDAGVPKVD